MTLIINSHISAIDLLLDQIRINPREEAKSLSKILIVNLMPNKRETEYQLLKILGGSYKDLKVDFLYTKTYQAKNTSSSYLKKAYKTLEEVEKTEYDGAIITGAPLEFVDFEDIIYWEELKSIIDYTNKNIKSTIYLCWASMAGLYYNYGISKNIIASKIVGVFDHGVEGDSLLLKDFNQEFKVVHSRYFQLIEEDIMQEEDLEILSRSKEVGIYMLVGNKGREIYITGHPEYNVDTLKKEYIRDLDKGLTETFPKHYFPEDNLKKTPIKTWEKDFQKMINNWIRYFL